MLGRPFNIAKIMTSKKITVKRVQVESNIAGCPPQRSQMRIFGLVDKKACTQFQKIQNLVRKIGKLQQNP